MKSRFVSFECTLFSEMHAFEPLVNIELVIMRFLPLFSSGKMRCHHRHPFSINYPLTESLRGSARWFPTPPLFLTRDQTLTPRFGARVLVQCARAFGSFIYYINAHLPHAREFSAYARERITRKLSVASSPARDSVSISISISKGFLMLPLFRTRNSVSISDCDTVLPLLFTGVSGSVDIGNIFGGIFA